MSKHRPLLSSAHDTARRHRSGSISSENSMNSQSTITAHHYSRYSAPSLHPSESSSSSQSHSRLSNYSAGSQSSNQSLPRARTASNNMLQQSRSFTTNQETLPRPSRVPSHLGHSQSQSKLAKRASHIPAPSSISVKPMSPAPQRTKSTHPSLSQESRLIGSQSRSSSRASHIPSARATVYRLTSSTDSSSSSSSSSSRHYGINPPSSPGTTSRAGSRLGMRSTTPGPRNSLFGALSSETRAKAQESTLPSSRPQSSLSTGRPSGLQPPGVRGLSRIGMVKK
ncbi:hypothetical protein BDF14DRAFT_1388641 [Spinellus fusiger]|nr:hypothetical protein BDF14DRAFT_1388641 [Spinellus fusiger]